MRKLILPKLTLVFPALLCANLLWGQPDLASFTYRNGLYLSTEAIAADQPSLPPEGFRYQSLEGGNDFQIYLHDFRANGRQLDPRSIWALSLDGVLYINQNRFSPNRSVDAVLKNQYPQKYATTFTRVAVAGPLCLLSLHGEQATWWSTRDGGKARFDYQTPQTVPYARQFLLKLSTGEVRRFNYRNVRELTADDPRLARLADQKGIKDKETLAYWLLREYNRNAAEGEQTVSAD